ncbi:hypothetical protein V8G54_025684 [Vigna mungo]|uniref:DUF3754 family protein n=1 Tax=Vigna mungo TaxID=3915 RepID=A0AAQ3MZF9_VIGMU
MSYCWHSLGLVPISQSQTLFSFSQTHGIFARQRVPCSLLQEMSVVEPSSQYKYQQQNNFTSISRNPSVGGDDDGDEEEGISKIGVPRQKHIPVSKSQLVDAILSIMFNQSQDVAHHFRLLTSCLDSILHAEHKSILEEMRSDYQLANSLQTHSSLTQLVNIPNVNTKDSDMLTDDNDIIAIQEDANLHDDQQDQREKSVLPYPALDLTALLRSLDIASTKKDYDSGSRVTIGTRFQHAFMKLLSDAQFEELSARDLMLTSALNSDYLLTLPIYVDWKRAYESNAIIFRRGYATEKQKGLLIVEKLDYLQSKILRGTFFVISKPLTKLGSWISELYENGSQRHEIQNWTESLRLWLKELSVFQKSLLYNDPASDEHIGINQEPNAELPIWLAAQRAVARYEGILSQVGPRGRLLRRMLSWIGLMPPLPETPFEVHNDNNTPEPHLRPTLLSRISLNDIWRPATRKYCGNDPWKMLKTSISILFSQSVLQEPAFEELILLYTKEVGETNGDDKADVSSLQLKIYERIPIPDLAVIFPHKKLSFRIIDTVRLDIATILGLLAYFINYKFENVLSSPSAILLDVVAISALIIYGSRVVLGYKQTWDRYQLLVNKTLNEKTLASGFGSVHFLLDASEQQQYKEAVLAYAILLKAEKGQVISRQTVGEKCERFLYEVFKVKVEMPIDKALNTLLRLGLATETCIDGNRGLLAIPCPEAYEALKERWNILLC